jgi:hypothetical protein
MKLSELGEIRIQAVPQKKSPGLLDVDIEVQNRVEGVSMTTRVDENVEQFGKRIASMLRGLFNTEVTKK